MARMTAGRSIIEALRAEGVDHTFGLVGVATNRRLAGFRHQSGRETSAL